MTRLILGIICVMLGIASFVWLLMQDKPQLPLTLKATSAVETLAAPPEKGQQLVEWEITNTTANKIRIVDIKTNCGCTVIKSCPEDVAANASVSVVTDRAFENSRRQRQDYAVSVLYRIEDAASLSSVGAVLQYDDFRLLQGDGS